MKVRVTSVPVQDQAQALEFYTNTLGFVKKLDIPMGEHRWLTVVSSEEPDGPEVLLEPVAFEPAAVYQKALFASGIPAGMFNVDDIQADFERLKGLGVQFKQEPMAAGPATIAILDDTCGNYIQLVQV